MFTAQKKSWLYGQQQQLRLLLVEVVKKHVFFALSWISGHLQIILPLVTSKITPPKTIMVNGCKWEIHHEWRCISCSPWGTVDGRNPASLFWNYQPQLVIAGCFPSTVILVYQRVTLGQPSVDFPELWIGLLPNSVPKNRSKKKTKNSKTSIPMVGFPMGFFRDFNSSTWNSVEFPYTNSKRFLDFTFLLDRGEIFPPLLFKEDFHSSTNPIRSKGCLYTYCWWTKSCTTKDGDYPSIHRPSQVVSRISSINNINH